MKQNSKIKQFNPFDNLHLDAEEQTIEDSLTRGEFEDTHNLHQTLLSALIRQYAEGRTKIEP